MGRECHGKEGKRERRRPGGGALGPSLDELDVVVVDDVVDGVLVATTACCSPPLPMEDVDGTSGEGGTSSAVTSFSMSPPRRTAAIRRADAALLLLPTNDGARDVLAT